MQLDHLLRFIPKFDVEHGFYVEPTVSASYSSARPNEKLWVWIEADMMERISELEGAAGRVIDRIRVCCQTVIRKAEERLPVAPPWRPLNESGGNDSIGKPS